MYPSGSPVDAAPAAEDEPLYTVRSRSGGVRRVRSVLDLRLSTLGSSLDRSILCTSWTDAHIPSPRDGSGSESAEELDVFGIPIPAPSVAPPHGSPVAANGGAPHGVSADGARTECKPNGIESELSTPIKQGATPESCATRQQQLLQQSTVIASFSSLDLSALLV